MTAAIRALEALREPCEIDLYTDSKYMIDGITQWIHGWKRKGWKSASKKPVLNEDLWRQLDSLRDEHKVNWHWVKGHAGHPENERVDQLASDAAERIAAAKTASNQELSTVSAPGRSS